MRLETVRAKAGALLLDIIRPGWAHEIDLGKLDLGDCDVCVLGQLYGQYNKGAETLFSMAEVPETNYSGNPVHGALNNGVWDTAARAGFVTPQYGNDYTYGQLTTVWKREIAKRQKA